jgi:hypothetical protein
MSNIERDEQGVDRCRRAVKAVVPNNPKNPTEGYKRIDAYCNKPVTFSVAERRKVCPDCDKQPPVGNVQPRTINAAGVSLTAKELEECGVMDGKDPSLNPPAEKAPVRAAPKPRAKKLAVEAKVKKEVRKDAVEMVVSLDLLEQSPDVIRTLITGAIEGMDKLPVTNFAESKRLIKLQEKLQSLLEA